MQERETALVPLRVAVPESVLEPEWVLASALDSATALVLDWAMALVLDLAKVPARDLATASVVQDSARVQVLRRAAAPRPE